MKKGRIKSLVFVSLALIIVLPAGIMGSTDLQLLIQLMGHGLGG